MPKINNNCVSLAGEFAVLSRLALHGYNANMTLGRTKGVDILVADPDSGRMLKLEVKTNYRSSRSAGGNSSIFGKYVSAWIMNEKHEKWVDPGLFYCFVNIAEETHNFSFYIVPSEVVASYVAKQHRIWLDGSPTRSRQNRMRTFRIGMKGEKYPLPTPLVEDYADNWDFKVKVRRSVRR